MAQYSMSDLISKWIKAGHPTGNGHTGRHGVAITWDERETKFVAIISCGTHDEGKGHGTTPDEAIFAAARDHSRIVREAREAPPTEKPKPHGDPSLN